MNIENFGKGAKREKWKLKDWKRHLFKRNVKVYLKYHAPVLKAGIMVDPYQIAQLFARKNQGANLGCGGYSHANHIRRQKYLRDGMAVDLSEYYIYGNCFLKGGGSNEGTLAEFMANNGAALQSDCPSTNADGTPFTEAQMEVKPMLSQDAQNNAMEQLITVGLTFNGNDISEVKQALSLGYGATCALEGNNQAWEEGVIQIPTSLDWGHFIDLLSNPGTGWTWFENSWGEEWGIKGFGQLPDTYFGGGRVYGEYCYILEPADTYIGLLETLENLLVNIINKLRHNT